MLSMGNVLSERLALTLNVFAARSAPHRYSFAVSAMTAKSLGHTAARLMAAMPKILPMRSSAASMSSSPAGSAYIVLCAL